MLILHVVVSFGKNKVWFYLKTKYGSNTTCLPYRIKNRTGFFLSRFLRNGTQFAFSCNATVFIKYPQHQFSTFFARLIFIESTPCVFLCAIIPHWFNRKCQQTPGPPRLSPHKANIKATGLFAFSQGLASGGKSSSNEVPPSAEKVPQRCYPLAPLSLGNCHIQEAARDSWPTEVAKNICPPHLSWPHKCLLRSVTGVREIVNRQ